MTKLQDGDKVTAIVTGKVRRRALDGSYVIVADMGKDFGVWDLGLLTDVTLSDYEPHSRTTHEVYDAHTS
jgi:hypothetical protein